MRCLSGGTWKWLVVDSCSLVVVRLAPNLKGEDKHFVKKHCDFWLIPSYNLSWIANSPQFIVQNNRLGYLINFNVRIVKKLYHFFGALVAKLNLEGFSLREKDYCHKGTKTQRAAIRQQ